MIWREVKNHPVPMDGFVLAWPCLGGVPEVWSAKVYHQARARSALTAAPGFVPHAQEAAAITHWAPVPPLPQTPTPTAGPQDSRLADKRCMEPAKPNGTNKSHLQTPGGEE